VNAATLRRRAIDAELTLLDTFAAAALQGILANPDITPDSHEDTARTAYNAAEAMVLEKMRRAQSV
jgi:hypothetical protein